jgi:hypothetical protein
MPFYLRKAVRAGPFRFNLSNSGIGISVGVKGLRVGTGPRGHYVHAGRGGLYYRASLGGTHNARPHGHAYPTPPVLSAFAPTGHTTRCRARLSGLQDAECDRRSAHVTKASRQTNSAISCASDPACANTCLRRAPGNSALLTWCS